MAIDINHYRKIQNAYNETDTLNQRDIRLFEVQRNLNRDFSKTLDAYTVTIDGINQDLTIIKTSNLHVKKIKSRPNEIFYIGQVVVFHGSNWLITEVDTNNDIITNGKMEECNYLLKWQNESGTIIERWAVVSSIGNDGTDENKVITVGSDQLSVVVTVDSETLKLKKSMNKKFFIDNNTTNPSAYQLIGTGNVVSTYGGHGVTSWVVKEVGYSPTADDLSYGVCNYFTPTTPVTPPDETTVLWYMKVDCPIRTIKPTGTIKTITGQLLDANGAEVTNDIIYDWTVTSNIAEYVTYTKNGNVLTISLSQECDDYGEEISITCFSVYTGQAETIILTVKEVF